LSERLSERLSIFVTVGMGPWPFDRLLDAVRTLCSEHDVFVQRGTSEVDLPCASEPFIGYHECQRRMRDADVVVMHAGNSVRLAQRMGKTPIIVAREADRGEMRNDHQVPYATREGEVGRAITLTGDSDVLGKALVDVVASGASQRERRVLRAASAERAATLLRQLPEWRRRSGPFDRHPTARYRWAFDHLRDRLGRHLELGIGSGEFLRALADETTLEVVAADAHGGYLEAAHASNPDLTLVQSQFPLPFAEASFDSVSLLDVLEHTPDDDETMAEVSRVLRPGGLLVMSVPAQHVFSFLDPDNAKFRFPRLHRAVYQTRFGRDTYRERFEDASNGLRGDLAWSRPQHTNYPAEAIVSLVMRHGLVPRTRDGANLLWRFVQVPALLLPRAASGALDAPLRWDGRRFDRANLFLTAVRA
jgi:SAM-dependent methyltransferase/UDP-N-acetylglucosamine transferase subunit ALG13